MGRVVTVGGRRIDVDAQLRALEAADCEDSLYVFLKTAWRYIDASTWRDGWAIEAIAEHLQAVVDGDIKRLIINIPPRCGKSAIASIALPAWTWAQPEDRWSPTCGPGARFLHASYAESLSLRDSVKCRRLIESSWYQGLWGDRFALNSDQNTKRRFGNDKHGERLITSIGGTGTGEGGDVIVVDDPNAAGEAFSEATIATTIDWWDTTMSTRLNDQNTGAYVVIQQRLAEDDLSGHILEKNRGEWTHLCLPMKFERNRSFVTTIGWEDPRTTDGELLWPERFSATAVGNLEHDLGPFGAAGQLQQRPEPAGGGIIKRDWWLNWAEPQFPMVDFVLGIVDTAYTEDTMNDPSGMIVLGVFTGDNVNQATRILDATGRPVFAARAEREGSPKVMLMYAWTERLELHDLVAKVAKTAKDFKLDRLRIENKASGISVAQEIRRLYADEIFAVQLADPKSQDKTSRLYSVQHLFAEGMVYAPDRPWAEAVITQVGQFPRGKHDEYVDCVSAGLRHLRDIGLLTRGEERIREIEGQKTYPGGQPAPLYPGT